MKTMGDIELSALNVVRLKEEDAVGIARMERECFSFPWTEEQLAKGISRNVLTVFGIKKASRLVAYCSFYMIGGESEIVNIAVDAALRHNGLGGKLLGHVLQYVRKAGIKRMFLEVRRSNAAAIALYRSVGFVQVGVRPAYYSDTGEDALVMALEFEE